MKAVGYETDGGKPIPTTSLFWIQNIDSFNAFILTESLLCYNDYYIICSAINLTYISLGADDIVKCICNMYSFNLNDIP